MWKRTNRPRSTAPAQSNTHPSIWAPHERILSDFEIRESLRKQYKKRGVVLFLGAGVSVGCDLPNWDQLLDRIYTDVIHDLPSSPSIKSIRSSFSATAFGGLLETLCQSEFSCVVRNCLYRDFPFYQER